MEEKNANIKIFGKVAAFPKPIKASNAYKYLEAVKVNKTKLWYILIQQQSDCLQMIKYNHVEGVNLLKFLQNLLDSYLVKYKDEDLNNKIMNIKIIGEKNYVTIVNIPNVSVNNIPFVALIAKDLINLLKEEKTIKNN